MRIRFSDPVEGGHEIQILVVNDVKFMGSLVLATTGVSQTVVARVVGERFRVASTGALFKRCEILPGNTPDTLDMTPHDR